MNEKRKQRLGNILKRDWERLSAKTVTLCLDKVFTTGFTRGINNKFTSLSCRIRLSDSFVVLHGEEVEKELYSSQLFLCLDKLVVRNIVSHSSVTPHSQIMALPCKWETRKHQLSVCKCVYMCIYRLSCMRLFCWRWAMQHSYSVVAWGNIAAFSVLRI